MNEDIDIEEVNNHHPYSPSKLEYLERCPCFNQDDSEDSEAAQRGTRLHEAVEHDDPDRIADPDDREQVLHCMLHKQLLMQKYPNAKVYNEMRIESSLNHGTGDLVLLDFVAGIAVVLDYKFGKEKVTAPERNLQLWSYAYALMSMYAEIHTVHIYVSQPQCSDDMEYFEIRRDMTGLIRSRIERVIERAEDPNKKPTADDKACGYCTKRLADGRPCPEMMRHAVDHFTQQYGLTVPANVMLGIDHSAQTVGQVYAFAKKLEEFAEAVRKSASERGVELKKQGIDVEGFSVVEVKGKYGVKDAEVMSEILHKKGLLQKAFETCATVWPNQIAEMVKDTLNEDPVAFLDELEKSGVIERGKGYSYMKKKPKTDLMKVLKGE